MRWLCSLSAPNLPGCARYLRVTVFKRLTKVGAASTDGIGNQYGRKHEPAPGSLAMISTTDPETMTADERRLEVASILAGGLLRRVRMARTTESPPRKKVSKRSRNRLELPAETTLSVAP